MSELERRLQDADRLLTPPTSAGDAERALSRFWAISRRRRHRKVIAASASIGTALVIATYLYAPRFDAKEPPIAVAPPPSERVVHFADGSQATLLSERTVLRVGQSSERLLEIELEVGKARFDVVPNQQRLFRVVTKALEVEVLGTAFTVSDEDGKTGVVVHRGRVAVLTAESRHELLPGMSIEVDSRTAVEPVAEEEEIVEQDLLEEEGRPLVQKHKRKVKKQRADAPTWRHLAEEGLFSEAYEALAGPDGEAAVSDVEGLMLAADVARLTGHPRVAAGYLERMIEAHRDAPQAVLAAFTLGRIRERELAQPARAAEAFETARLLGPDSSLAADALAHEVECSLAAGDRPKAVARAQLYLERHPSGRQVARMRALIGQ